MSEGAYWCLSVPIDALWCLRVGSLRVPTGV